jgi:NADP-dependent 3-hydroxy acid dehydrogenase YdfG
MSAPKVRPYSLSKQLVHEMICALRADRPDLRVKAVYPGAVKTPMTMAGFTSEAEYDRQALANWGVVSTADDVADRILLLLESDADNLLWDPERKEYVFE